MPGRSSTWARRRSPRRCELAIGHEQDLVADTSAFVSRNPNVSPADFDRWAEAARAMQRYPELQDIGLVALVPASRLKAFEAHLAANPIRPLGPNSVGPKEPFQIIPAGHAAVLLLRRRRPGTEPLHLPARRGRFLRAGADADRRAGNRGSHLRARTRRQQERARGPDPGLPRAASGPPPRRRDGRRSSAGSASC